MRSHKSFEEIPSNSRENVLEVVEKDFDCKVMPKLLSEFIELLGNEKEEWGGVAAMKACVEEFFRWKKPEGSTAKGYTAEFFEEFLFSRKRYVHIQGPDRPSTTKAVNLGAVVPYANPEKLKALDRPSTSKTVVDPPKNLETLKGTDCPSTSKAVTQGVGGQTSVPPANPKKLKVKIYMGSGWDRDFPKLYRRSPPDLFVNLRIHGARSQKTKVKKNTRTPCWGEEFEFLLSNSEDTNLNVEVYYDHKKYAGMFRLPMSELKPGIHVIPLYFEVGKPCSSARLLVRFMFV